MRGDRCISFVWIFFVNLHGTSEETWWKVLVGLLPEITLCYIFFTSLSGVQGVLFSYIVLTLSVVILILSN